MLDRIDSATATLPLAALSCSSLRADGVNLAILGATGSIGTSTLDVVARHPDRYRVVGARRAQLGRRAARALPRVTARARGARGRQRQARELRAPRSRIGARECCSAPRRSSRWRAHARSESVMAAIVGAAGLASTLAAARAGKRVLLANKEALVMAGPLFMRAAREARRARCCPIDSEHNAVFQCLPRERSKRAGVRRIVLTASGGPFRATPLEASRA